MRTVKPTIKVIAILILTKITLSIATLKMSVNFLQQIVEHFSYSDSTFSSSIEMTSFILLLLSKLAFSSF